ncbi:hypothetical protein SAMN05421766_104341 [Zobellia uliginosa]|uniref:Uncharacterized protein n=1 Tax=Zobellia uliginosa TaxID=143224 RepID=A0ABY1KVT4_9FLAO|nr:hypothetical protein [Zobellia uliginosa]SIS84612.1 hypothetical protein SAMN05421766_104341 [Zobellia uliginosa]
MKKIIFGLLTCLCSLFASAHSSQIATMTLAQDQENNWTLHISSSFNGFRSQLIQNYPDLQMDALSADEFQKLVITYVKDNILLKANSDFTGELKEGAIKMGHQTDLKFRVVGLPSALTTLQVKLKGFKQNSKHNTVFKIIDQADSSENFVIKKDNQFTVQVEKINGHFQTKGEESNLFWPFISLNILVVVSSIMIVKIFKPEKSELSPA